jgi:S-methylmethionine-dependent homocysteine/selenocysteine methylase
MLPRPICLLDGATGTELGRRGADISTPLWSARAIIEAPELLAQIHRDYLEAGAGAITTATFRTHRRSLAKAGMDDRAAELTRQAVEIARRVRDEVKPDALVLGSVGPLEDCYHPEQSPSAEACAAEHAEMIRHLLDAGVDAILIETMNTLREASAAAAQTRKLISGTSGGWMIGFITKSSGPPGILFDGDSIIDLLGTLHDAEAVGVNCVAAQSVEPQVRLLRRLLPPEVRVMAYANTGEPDDVGGWHDSNAADPQRYAEYAASWVEAGASVLGGCCGTTPETIRALQLVASPKRG